MFSNTKQNLRWVGDEPTLKLDELTAHYPLIFFSFALHSSICLFRGRFHGEKIPKSETEKAETICTEVTRYYTEKVVHVIHLLSSKLLENGDFEDISVMLNKALNKYNLHSAGDFNINTLRTRSDWSNHFSNLSDTCLAWLIKILLVSNHIKTLLLI